MSEAPHILVVESPYYQDVAEQLAKGAVEEIERSGASYERLAVPGAFEIPAAIKMAIRSLDFYSGRQRFDGFVALGCVIRGETTHYDYICAESARQLQELAVRYTLAVGYGILTCESHEQAMVRAAVEQKNKGGDAARACLQMIDIKRRFHLFPR